MPFAPRRTAVESTPLAYPFIGHPGRKLPHQPQPSKARFPFASGDADPEPVLRAGGSPLLFYNVTGALSGPIRLSKDLPAESVRIDW